MLYLLLRQLKKQKQLSQQALQNHADQRREDANGETFAAYEDEIGALKEQIKTLQLFIETEEIHQPVKGAGNDSLLSDRDKVVEALEEKVSALETDLLATKLRNATLEEENLKVRNELQKLRVCRAQEEASVVAAISPEVPKAAAPLSMWGGLNRPRRGSV